MTGASDKLTGMTDSRVVLRTSRRAVTRRMRRESGSALLIVLALIVILAVVLTAFLSNSRRALQQSEASTNLLKTQLLGQVATAAIVEDLSEEMRAGAGVDEEPAVGVIMEVTQPRAMVPGRVLKNPAMLTDPNYVNLVKQSVSGQPFFPGDNTATFWHPGKKRASSMSTATPSRNERVISAERWDRPKLLGGASGLAKFTSAQAPDWILITRSGAVEDGTTVGNVSDKTPANEDYILGRYAYNIYRVDGLLDINVAGFDPKDSAAQAKAATKGSTAWADLRAIPGLENDNSVEALVKWRNKESHQNYPEMVAGLTGTSLPGSSPHPWGEPGGFNESYTEGLKTDNRFFSRQDLLNYFSHQFGTGSDAALPFLTTFSADLDQPSFRPDPNRPKIERGANAGGNDAYGDDTTPPQDAYKEINPPLLAVLDSDGGPVVKRRFPLDRLRYVVPKPVGEASKQAIRDYFGLVWNDEADKQYWEYIDGDSIKRLSEIQNREPNMIELLRASIAVGSLGGQFSMDEKLGSPREIGKRDASINYHVMRIAACIIDQYDSDSYPTRIQFGNYTAYGVENLPYLYGMRVAAYRQTQLNPATDVDPAKGAYPTVAETTFPLYRSVIMMQPIVWNPHAPPVSSTGPATPTAFRITANGGGVRPAARRAWWVAGTTYQSNWPSKTNSPKDVDAPTAFSPIVDYITFSVSSNSTVKASFREPYTLKSPNYPPGSNATAFDASGVFFETTLNVLEQNDSDPAKSDERDNRAIGFRAGWAWSGPYKPGSTSTGNLQFWLQEGQVASNGIDLELQYQTPSGDWITYDSFEKFNAEYNYRQGRLSSGSENPVAMRYHMRTDPRVDRYGARSSLFLPGAGASGVAFTQGQSMRPGSDAGFYTTSGWPLTAAEGESLFNFHFPDATANRFLGLLSENRKSGVWYEDPDGVARLAMGGLSSGEGGLPMVTGNYASRPVVLNRPFRSVTELGYVLRDQPWKQLDFFSPESGDAALLDMFCLYEPADSEADPIVAGRVNLNTKRPEVVEALLRGVEVQDGGATLTNSQAKKLAEELVDWTSSADSGKGPLRNRSELVGKVVSPTTYKGFSSVLDDVLSGTDKAIPTRRQSVMRALADPGTTRAWTFLIDLVVQDGQFIGAGGGAGDFAVRGEKRYWVHVSMDRFTGKVTSERVEEVYE